LQLKTTLTRKTLQLLSNPMTFESSKPSTRCLAFVLTQKGPDQMIRADACAS